MNLDEWLDIKEGPLPKDANIIFVCVGNINRSPACEIILNDMLKFSHKLNWTVDSAAISEKNEGKLTSKKMRDSLEKFGYKYVETRSKPITQQMVDDADVIYIMDNANQKKMIEKFGANILNKMRFVGAINPGKDGIYVSDPHFAKGTGEHEKVVLQIESCLHRLVDQHRELYK